MSCFVRSSLSQKSGRGRFTRGARSWTPPCALAPAGFTTSIPSPMPPKSSASQIAIGQLAAVAVAVQPIIQKCLVEKRRDDLFAEFMSVGAEEWQAQPGEYRNQRLHDAIGAGSAVRILGLDLRHRRGHDQQTVWRSGYSLQPLHEDAPVRGERLDQVGEVLAFDDARVFHAGDRVIAERQRAVLDAGEPFPETPER